MNLYEGLSQLSGWISQPFTSIAYSTDIAILAALILGFIGSVAPCQITANLGAITYFGNRHAQNQISWSEIFFFIVGKVLVYSVFGFIFWLLGQGISNASIPFFAWSRKFIGPLLIIMGVFLLGWIRLPGNVGGQVSQRLRSTADRLGSKGSSFLMGIAFSLGFCPTMFWLFFGLLMPLSLKSFMGPLLPPVFAIGTSLPLFIFIGLYIGMGLDRWVIKRARSWGGWIQKGVGVFFVLLGLLDTLTYWSI